MKQTILPCGVLIIIAITIGTLLFAEQCVGQNEKQEKTDQLGITPPLLPPDVRSGHDISMQVVVNAGTVLKEVGSPSHKVKIVRNNDGY